MKILSKKKYEIIRLKKRTVVIEILTSFMYAPLLLSAYDCGLRIFFTFGPALSYTIP